MCISVASHTYACTCQAHLLRVIIWASAAQVVLISADTAHNTCNKNLKHHDETACTAAATSRGGIAWIDIESPRSAQLFTEGAFEEIRLRYRVHGVRVGRDQAVVHVYVIK